MFLEDYITYVNKDAFDFSYENISPANQITSSSGNSSYDCCLEKLKTCKVKSLLKG
jgi:hypothetical protein